MPEVVVVGSGMAGLIAARELADAGVAVVVLDKGRVPGGRLATREMRGGALADHGAQFFTARSREFSDAVDDWVHAGLAHEWCRGFSRSDGHPRYAAPGGMGRLAGHLAAGLDVRQSTRATDISRENGRWTVAWPAAHGHAEGRISAPRLLVTAPVPQAALLLGGRPDVPTMRYERAISLLAELDGPAAVPAPGGVQLTGDATWSWIGDNVAKGTSALPSLTFHTRADVAELWWGREPGALTASLIAAASPWLGGASMLDVSMHRWLYATPITPHKQPYLALDGGTLLLAGDAFAGPRLEGAFLSGRAASGAILASLG